MTVLHHIVHLWNRVDGAWTVLLITVFVPQEPAPMTEDLLEEQSEVLAKLGTSAEGAHLRARMQSACLLSDMESFKVSRLLVSVWLVWDAVRGLKVMIALHSGVRNEHLHAPHALLMFSVSLDLCPGSRSLSVLSPVIHCESSWSPDHCVTAHCQPEEHHLQGHPAWGLHEGLSLLRNVFFYPSEFDFISHNSEKTSQNCKIKGCN